MSWDVSRPLAERVGSLDDFAGRAKTSGRRNVGAQDPQCKVSITKLHLDLLRADLYDRGGGTAMTVGNWGYDVRQAFDWCCIVHTMFPSLRASSSRLALARPFNRSSILPTKALIPSFRTYADEAASALAKLDAGEQGIYDKLSAQFPGKRLEVQDVSGQLNSLCCYGWGQ
jgi:hypothetical protein